MRVDVETVGVVCQPHTSWRGGTYLPKRPPHIVILMADDLGLVDTSYAGSSILSTPHLDALAAQAMHFTNFRAPNWCAPSRMSFLTGRHGWELGLASAHGWTVVSRDTPLLSEVLRELGYWTAVVGKFHSNPQTCTLHASGGGFGCGFDQQAKLSPDISQLAVPRKRL